MSGLFVDTHALAGLALRMARTRDEVAYAARLVDECAGGAAVGPALARALVDFDEHWRYGLNRLVANLDACHTALHDATAAYEQVEQAIARAAGDPGGEW